MEVYKGVPDFLSKVPLKDEDLHEAVLQVCSEIDKPDPPGPAARKAFSRLIVGLKDEVRQQFKEQLLKLTKDKVLTAADTYLASLDKSGGIAVIAGQPHLADANKQLTGEGLRIAAI